MNGKLCISLTATALLVSAAVSFGQAPTLGTAADFAVFTAAGGFTNDGATTITGGDIGTHVGSFTGFPPGTLTGQIQVANPVSAQAATDVKTAYSFLAGITCGSVIGTTLGNNQVLTPGVYCLGAASSLIGNLTFDGQGSTDGLFVIKIDGALSTAALSTIKLINGASCERVYFQVNGAVGLGTNSTFVGIILANGAISLMEGAVLRGRALSREGAIALHSNTITAPVVPTPTIATDSQTVCTGQAATLTVQNCAGSVRWSANAGGATTVTVSVTPTAPTTYSVSCAVDDCTGTATVTVTVQDCATAATTGSMGGAVWIDLNRNGRADFSTETVVLGVTVRLLAVTSPVGASAVSTTLVSTTQTNGSGNYVFPNLPAGRYVVEFDKTTLPANYAISPDYKKPGVGDELDSDANPTTGLSPILDIVPTNPITRNFLNVFAGLVDTTCPPPQCLSIVIKRIR